MDNPITPSSGFIFPPTRRRIIRQHSRILASATFFPQRSVSNQEIIDAYHLPVTDQAVRKTLGVAQRRVAEAGITDSDLLTAAAQRCLEQAGINANQLTKILVTKFIGDRILPMTASLVQRKLGNDATLQVAMHAVDLEGGGNAFINALDLSTRYISTTAADEQYILILSGGLHNLPVSKTDPRLAFLFGDGAAALLLAPAPQAHFLASYSYTNYAYFHVAGTRRMLMDQKVSDRLYEQGDFELLFDLYQMGNWKETLDFYLQAAEVTCQRLLEESGLALADIDLVLVTENNQRLRELTLARLGVSPDRSLSVISEYGNTMTAMLPILLDQAFREGRLGAGKRVMLISHAEGASGGGMIYQV